MGALVYIVFTSSALVHGMHLLPGIAVMKGTALSHLDSYALFSRASGDSVPLDRCFDAHPSTWQDTSKSEFRDRNLESSLALL